MRIIKLSEYGYEEAALGFSLSYSTSIERAKQILPRYANGIPGENKFLESMIFYLDVSAPRFFWQEADTYRVGSTKQSESTMHTLAKTPFTNSMFEWPLGESQLRLLEEDRLAYINKEISIDEFKSMIPEGLLQRRIWLLSYKTFKNIYFQRYNHRLHQWKYFCSTVLNEIDHPEFIVSP